MASFLTATNTVSPLCVSIARIHVINGSSGQTRRWFHRHLHRLTSVRSTEPIPSELTRDEGKSIVQAYHDSTVRAEALYVEKKAKAQEEIEWAVIKAQIDRALPSSSLSSTPPSPVV